jgi:hypothetical protein
MTRISTARGSRSSSASQHRSRAARSACLLGVTSAYLGGKVDLFLERLMDILLAFPQLISLA